MTIIELHLILRILGSKLIEVVKNELSISQVQLEQISFNSDVIVSARQKE